MRRWRPPATVAYVRSRRRMPSPDACVGARASESRTIKSAGSEAQRPRRSSMTDVRNVVLVHGGFVDGSGWRGVYDLLTADGFNVSVVQNQTLSLESDVETTQQRARPAGRPGDPRRPLLRRRRHHRGRAPRARRRPRLHRRVRARRRRVGQHPDRRPAARTRPCRRSCRPSDGFLFLDREKFAHSFAADLPAERRGLHGRLAGPVGRRGAQRRGHANRPGAASRAGTWSPPTTA